MFMHFKTYSMMLSLQKQSTQNEKLQEELLLMSIQFNQMWSFPIVHLPYLN